MRGAFSLIALAILLAIAGCRGREEPSAEEAPPAPVPTRAPDAGDSRPLIVAFGDSLTAGHGPGAERNYPAFLQQELDRRGHKYRVVNAGVGGDTTGGGLARVDTVIGMKPAIVILEFGGNDGLRGLPVASMRANLDEMIGRVKDAGVRVLLAGITLPPNYGPDYIGQFDRVYRELAAKHQVPLIPFLLEGVGGTARYMQSDGIHPTGEGNRRVAATVMKVLEPML